MAKEPVKILITGASGFIGSFLCEKALGERMDVWAGVRRSSSRRWLQDGRLHFQTLDMADPAALRGQLEAFRRREGRWDVVVHAAGATKCLDAAEFDSSNFGCTVNLVEALRALGMAPRLFVYVSSLSVLGPVRERPVPYEDMTADDAPRPNTAYGRSKLKSENYLRGLGAAFPHVVFRPTGVYGPRERDYFLMAKSVRRHVGFSVGFRPQDLTFVYVEDLAGAIFAAVGKALRGGLRQVEGRTFHVSDGRVYPSRAFSDLVQKELGVRGVLHVTAPLWLLRCVCAVSEWASRLLGKPSTLNGDKYKIMCQRNWRCDITPLRRELGYEPQWPLERGVKATVDWYKAMKWI